MKLEYCIFYKKIRDMRKLDIHVFMVFCMVLAGIFCSGVLEFVKMVSAFCYSG
jgi:hypothetical protein